jgi:hypothetical protein
LPEGFSSLKAEELAILCINGANAIFEKASIKADYKKLLSHWIEKYALNQSYIENY